VIGLGGIVELAPFAIRADNLGEAWIRDFQRE
jgi:hypothetical protein